MPELANDDATIHFTDSGAGPAVMLVHGFPLDGRVWGDVGAMLASRFRVIVPDLPGFGKSVARRPFTMDSLARSLIALADHLTIDRFAIAGLSMGGYVAQALVRVAPQRLSALSLVDTRANADDEKGRAGRDAMAALARETGTAAVAAKMLPNMLHASAYTNDPALVDRLHELMLDQRAETLANACEAMRDRPAFFDALPTLAMPVQVIVGDDDRIAPPDVARHFAAMAKHARVDVIPRAGHMAPLETPAAVAEAIEAFLSGPLAPVPGGEGYGEGVATYAPRRKPVADHSTFDVERSMFGVRIECERRTSNAQRPISNRILAIASRYPLTPTLSPGYGGEGAKDFRYRVRR